MKTNTRRLCLALVAYLVLVTAVVLLLTQDAGAQEYEGMSVEDRDTPSQPVEPTPEQPAKESPSADTDAKAAPENPDDAQKSADEDIKIGETTDPRENTPLAESTAKDSTLTGDMGKILLYMGAIVVLIVASLMVFKKFLPGGNRIFQSKVIEVLGRTYIAPKQGLFLIKVADRILLVGSTGGAINTLCEITDPDEILRIKETAGSGGGVSEGLASAFRSMLGRDRGKFDHVEPVSAASGKAKNEMGKIKGMITNWRERHSE